MGGTDRPEKKEPHTITFFLAMVYGLCFRMF
nr:MAG TPA: envelope glycoprotein [Caudoviricetes sp.]